MYTKSSSSLIKYAHRKSCCSPFSSFVTILICDLCIYFLVFIAHYFTMFDILQTTSFDIDFIPQYTSFCISWNSLIYYFFILITLQAVNTFRKFLLFRDKPLTATTFCDTIFIAIYLRVDGKIEETRHTQLQIIKVKTVSFINSITLLLQKLQVRILSIYKFFRWTFTPLCTEYYTIKWETQRIEIVI